MSYYLQDLSTANERGWTFLFRRTAERGRPHRSVSSWGSYIYFFSFLSFAPPLSFLFLSSFIIFNSSFSSFFLSSSHPSPLSPLSPPSPPPLLIPPQTSGILPSTCREHNSSPSSAGATGARKGLGSSSSVTREWRPCLAALASDGTQLKARKEHGAAVQVRHFKVVGTSEHYLCL